MKDRKLPILCANHWIKLCCWHWCCTIAATAKELKGLCQVWSDSRSNSMPMQIKCQILCWLQALHFRWSQKCLWANVKDGCPSPKWLCIAEFGLPDGMHTAGIDPAWWEYLLAHWKKLCSIDCKAWRVIGLWRHWKKIPQPIGRLGTFSYFTIGDLLWKLACSEQFQQDRKMYDMQIKNNPDLFWRTHVITCCFQIRAVKQVLLRMQGCGWNLDDDRDALQSFHLPNAGLVSALACGSYLGKFRHCSRNASNWKRSSHG